MNDAVQGDSASYASEGHGLLTREDYKAAEAAFREAVRLDTDRADYHAGLGQTLLGQKRYGAAGRAFGEAVELRPDNADYLAGLGRAQLGQRHYSEAEDAYRRATGLEADRPDYHAGLGEALLGQELYGPSEGAFRQAVALQPDNAEYRDGLENARQGRERYEAAARTTIGNGGEPAPESDGQGRHSWARPGGKRYIGLHLPGQGSYQRIDAKDLTHESADLTRPVVDSAESHAIVGRALLDQRHYDKAEAAFREAVRLRPDRAGYMADLGYALLGQQRYREAGQQFRAAVSLAPDRADYLAALGRARLGQSHYGEAGASFSEAVQIAPDRPDYLSGLGHARLGEERYQEAETAFRHAIDLQPDSEQALDGLGRTLLGQQRYRDAEAIFARAVTLQANSAGYRGGLGQALLGQKRYGEAETAFRGAIAQQPDRADHRTGLGEALLGQGQYSDAETAFSEAVMLQPENAYYHAGLGHARAGQQEYSSAEAEFRSAVKLDPNSLRYRASLGKTLLCQGRLEDAHSVLDEAVAIDPGAEETVGLRQAISDAYDDEIISHILQRAKDALDARADISTIQPERYLDHVRAFSSQNISGIREPFREWRTAAQNAKLRSRLSRSAAAIRSRQVRAARSPLGLLLDRLDTLIDNIILEPAITAALGVVWRDPADDIVTVIDGPELSTKAEPDNIVPTEAFVRLAKSLARKHGAAVGIAGPRGSGKTELARAFTELGLHGSPTRTIPLMLWAPVKYNAQTFLLRLLKELCINIISTGCHAPIGSDPIFALHHRQRTVMFFFIAASLITIGALLIIAKSLNFDFRTWSSVLIGGELIAAGLSVVILEWSSRTGPPLPMRGDLMSLKTIKLATELRSRVEFTETYSKGSTIGVGGKNVAVTATTGTQLARIPLNEIDVVRELRNMADTLAADSWQVVIALDELDKISDEREALKFLNHVKVLFPIHECSFIVSVSQNAWSLFECRGIPLRDAFDSSFDEIVLVDMLRPEESRNLLKRRCRDITDVQALFCHCLSGGLPRDLLRAARFLAQVASSSAGSSSLSNVLDELFNKDLMAKVAAVRHGIPSQPEDLSDMDHAQLRHWIDSRWSGIASDIQPDRKTIGAYASFLHTLREAFTTGGPLRRLDAREGFQDPLITEGFDLMAQARKSLAEDVSTTYELLERAKKNLGIGVGELAQ